ncbi:uncharacterized protein LOC111694523 [Trichogramma pretiosum]|uniref:uncharacterized protein LOC111694523 n=1 Tax=Trichogramma pretiosum TaxID=7493 RepID=UPI000C71897B|nr:uncharacterized protein LOC111694523 [Trichogramma pretiosum]
MTSNRLWRTCLIASACCILTLRAQPLERKYAASDGSAVIITPAQPAQERSGGGGDDDHGIAAPEADFDIMHLDDGLTDEERARLDIEDLERGNNESEAEAERQDYGKVVKALTGSLGKQQSKKQYRNQQQQLQQQLVASYAF